MRGPPSLGVLGCRSALWPRRGSSSDRRQDGLVGDRTQLRLDHHTVGADQHPRGLRRDAELGPGHACLVPQQLHCADLVAGEERLGLTEVILRTKADDGDRCSVLPSKLLDPGRFPVALASMRCPEPHE